MISKITCLVLLSNIALSISVIKTDCPGEILNVQTKLLSQEKEITVLRKEVSELKKLEHDVKNVLEKCKLDHEAGGDISNLEPITHHVDINKEHYKSYDGGHIEKAKERRKRLAASGIQAGFTAFRRKGIALDSGKVIVFEDVRTNAGSAYDNTSGVFTAKQAGLYAFFTNIECEPHSSGIFMDIVKNDFPISNLYCHGTNNNDNTATMAVISLNIGDRVFVRPYGVSGSFQLGSKTTFSGFLTGFATDSS